MAEEFEDIRRDNLYGNPDAIRKVLEHLHVWEEKAQSPPHFGLPEQYTSIITDLKIALKRLDPPERNAVYLTVVYGFPAHEVSRRMKITIKSAQHLVRKGLQDMSNSLSGIVNGNSG